MKQGNCMDVIIPKSNQKFINLNL